MSVRVGTAHRHTASDESGKAADEMQRTIESVDMSLWANGYPVTHQPITGTNVDGIPPEMKAARRWVLSSANKEPKQPNGQNAENDNPATWVDFDAAVAALRSRPDLFTSLGFELGDGWAGIDYDGTNMLDPSFVRYAVDFVGGFAEYSRSGHGIHSIAQVPSGYKLDGGKQFFKKDDSGNLVLDENGHKVGYEVYDGSKARYFAITGVAVPGHDGSMRHGMPDSASGIRDVHAELERRKKAQDARIREARMGNIPAPVTQASRSDADEILNALNHINCAQLTYDEWLQVGIELKAAGYTYDVWDSFSQTDAARYKGGECAKKWDGFEYSTPSLWIYKKAHEQDPRYHSQQWEDEARQAKEMGLSAPREGAGADTPREKQPEDERPKPPKWVDMRDYLKDGGAWDTERQRRQDMGTVSTGFKRLDSYIGGGLTPDLYLIGGGPGMGKTSIALQIADNVAAAGWPVLYVCTEQTPFELACKSVARTAYLMGATDDGHKMTALSLIQGYYPVRARAAVEEYVSRETPVVIGADFDESIESVSKKVDAYEAHIRAQGVTRPLTVIIDYLQLLRSDAAGSSASEREITDRKVAALKAMQKNDGGQARIMIVLSSLNRDSYKDKAAMNTTPTLASFKESGSIEYTAAMAIMLWRFAGIHTKNADIDADVDKPDGAVIRARIVKNRYGIADRTVWMLHNKEHDYVETMSHEDMVTRGYIDTKDEDEEEVSPREVWGNAGDSLVM